MADGRTLLEPSEEATPEQLSLSPCCTSALWRVRNTFQGAESIQELLVLLQVHFPAEPTPAPQLGGIGVPTSPSHRHRLGSPTGFAAVAL